MNLRGNKDGYFGKSIVGILSTIVVARIAGTDEIVGGYNPLAWDNSKCDYVRTEDGFILFIKKGEYSKFNSQQS